MATIVLKRKKLTFIQKLYIFEVIRGLAITMRHLLKNMFNPGDMMTYEYPEQQKPIDSIHRSEHRLMLRDDNSIRCTACMLCATVCPAKCIHIEAAEGVKADNEKYAEKYTIDLLRCIYCGFCVEACPCDAVRMDTGKLVESYYAREDFVKDINYIF